MRSIAMLAVAVAPLLPADAAAPAKPYWARAGCDHGHRSSVAYKRIRALLRNHNPYPRTARAGHYARCTATRAKARHAHRLARSHWRWRHSYAHRWPIAFARLPAWDRTWVYSTGACESGNNPATATGNGFYGAHQWLLSTWGTAVRMFGGGWPSNPVYASYPHQGVVAVGWRNYAGASQWPNCG